MKNNKVAVVGGGIYGITISSELAKQHRVDLFESQDDILKAASGINQFRLHKGYHYPRSAKTAITSLKNELIFLNEYGESVINSTSNYYCIAKDNSKTSAKKYLEFLKKHKLKFKIENTPLVNKKLIQLSIKAEENLIDPILLKKVAWRKLKKTNVNIFLNTKANDSILKKYDFVIICTYANINKLLKKFPEHQKNYQYELVEKIVARLPKDFNNKSIVIMDGPFMCIDPYGQTNSFLMGNVVHAIHQANVGKYPKTNTKYSKLLNRGIIKSPPVTTFRKFIESSEVFIPKLKYAKYIGSMFTYRTVLPNKDKTDERPTIVNKVDNRIYTVFSGKIINCVATAKDLAKRLEK